MGLKERTGPPCRLRKKKEVLQPRSERRMNRNPQLNLCYQEKKETPLIHFVGGRRMQEGGKEGRDHIDF